MSGFWPELPFSTLAARFLVLLLGAALKGSLVFALAFGAAFLMRDSAARLRHLLWLGALASFLFIPLLSPFSPPLLPWPGPVQALPDGLYGAVSGALLPHGGVAIPLLTQCNGLGRLPPKGPSWALPLFLLWLTGAAASLIRVAIGSVRVRLQAVEARRRALQKPGRRLRTAGKLVQEAGIRRQVQVLESPTCCVPYARGILRPLVMLPVTARGWGPRRLRAVLLHELRHIQSLDCLTQGIARGICSLFWFVPCVWMAFSRLCAEQEKRCDDGVLEKGVTPRDYAACLVAAVRRRLEPYALAGLNSPSWSRRVLQERIQSILGWRGAGKNHWLVFAFAGFVAISLVLLGGAGGNRALPIQQAYDRFVGVWVNEVYPGDMFQPEVRILRPDYIGVDQLVAGSKAKSGVWEIVARKAWNDPRGNTYCQFSWLYTQGWRAGENWRRGSGLMRVDRAGAIWEANFRWGTVDGPFPERIDIEAREYGYRYFIYYRK